MFYNKTFQDRETGVDFIKLGTQRKSYRYLYPFALYASKKPLKSWA